MYGLNDGCMCSGQLNVEVCVNLVGYHNLGLGGEVCGVNMIGLAVLRGIYVVFCRFGGGSQRGKEKRMTCWKRRVF